MRNINTINTKGNTNVNSEVENPESEKIFESVNADVIRDESRWDAFQLMGDTNNEEIMHQAEPPKNKAKLERSVKRGEAFVNERIRKFGGKVAAVYGYVASRA